MLAQPTEVLVMILKKVSRETISDKNDNCADISIEDLS